MADVFWQQDLAHLAVVPSVLGGVNTLMLVLPQIILAAVLALKFLKSPTAWRAALARFLENARHRPFKVFGTLAAVFLGAGLVAWCVMPSSSFSHLAPPAEPGEEWPGFHGNDARTGVTPSAPADLSNWSLVRWKFRDPLLMDRLPFVSSPAVAGRQVVAGADNQKVYSLDAGDGRMHWVFDARHPVFSSPAIHGGKVYVGEGLHYAQDARLYCLDLRSGRLLWDFQTGSHVESSPSVADGRVYFGAGDDGVYCLDAETGGRVWRFAEGHVDSGLLVTDGRVYFGSGYREDALFCLDADSGAIQWKLSTPAPVWGAPALRDGRLYVGVGNGNFESSDANPLGEVWCLDARDGSIVWRFDGIGDGVLTAVAVTETHAVFGSRDGACHALDPVSGRLLWRYETGAAILSSPAVTHSHAVVGSDDGILRCIDLASGELVWSHDVSEDVLNLMAPVGRIQSSPVVCREGIIFGTSNGMLYCLSDVAASEGGAAQAAFRAPLLRGAQWVWSGLMNWCVRLTGSHGVALLLAAAFLRGVLLPIDWMQAMQVRRIKALTPAIEALRRDYVDHRVYQHDLRALHSASGVQPWRALGLAVLQVGLFIVVFLVLQASDQFSGRPFLWISDLAAPDRLMAFSPSAQDGLQINVLPLALAAAVWVYLRHSVTAKRRSLFTSGLCLLVSGGMVVLTYEWPASWLLFTFILLALGVASQRLLSLERFHPRRAAPSARIS